jgi:transaldolase
VGPVGGRDWILDRIGATDETVDHLSVKIFADGADYRHAGLPAAVHQGIRDNPTLMRKAGIADYRGFAGSPRRDSDRPISFEVFSDEFCEMGSRRARSPAGGQRLREDPVTTPGETAGPLVSGVARGVKLNVTALLPRDQVRDVTAAVAGGAPACISVFAGRIADTGYDPVPLMAAAVELMRLAPNAELIWASPRELLNIFHADAIGCHIITVTHDILTKLSLVGYDLREYSLDTVKMFTRTQSRQDSL